MKRFVIALLTMTLLVPAARAPAASKLRVVATIPGPANRRRHIGGDLCDVSSIATGVENIHAVPMKPSFATLLNRAEVLLLLGLEAEHAFLPALIEASKNPKIMRDAPGYVDCSVEVSVLDVPTRIDRSLGDQHPMG